MPLACFVCVSQLLHTFYFLISVYCKHVFYSPCDEPSLDKQSKRNIYAIGLSLSLVTLFVLDHKILERHLLNLILYCDR